MRASHSLASWLADKYACSLRTAAEIEASEERERGAFMSPLSRGLSATTYYTTHTRCFCSASLQQLWLACIVETPVRTTACSYPVSTRYHHHHHHHDQNRQRRGTRPAGVLNPLPEPPLSLYSPNQLTHILHLFCARARMTS